MTAILSTTFDDMYQFYLPLTIYSWNKLGIDVVCFIDTPAYPSGSEMAKMHLIENTGRNTVTFCPILCKPEQAATYAQCSRLYAAALTDIDPDPTEVLITSDIDMAVFNREYWQQFDHNGWINVIGTDLVPPGQYPMCYITAPVAAWYNVMHINGRTYQQCLDDLLGEINVEHMRGNYWAKDQEEIYNRVQALGIAGVVHEHKRAFPGTQFATRRADRDGWPDTIDTNIIDSHLPRPGYTTENFKRILDLFNTMYPGDDHSWMQEYRDKYVKLME